MSNSTASRTRNLDRNHTTPRESADPAARAGEGGRAMAIIDIGSSSVRLLVTKVSDSGSMNLVGQDRVMTRLGDGLAAKGRLSKDAMAQSLEAIASMTQKARTLGAGDIRAFATAAVRESTNGPDFVEVIRERTGVPVSILNEGEEGRLAYAAVASAMDLSSRDAAVFDLGGGSLQLIHSRQGTIISNASMKLGAVRMLRLFSGDKGLTPHRQKLLARHATLAIRERLDKGLPRPSLVVGVGGTATTILSMARAGASEKKQGGIVQLEDIRTLIELVRATPLEDRRDIPGLMPDRTDVILPGLLVVERLLTELGVETLSVSSVGLREGLVLKCLRDRHAGDEATPADADAPRTLGPVAIETIRQFAAACGYERSHSEHVRTLALSIFDQLLQLTPPTKAARAIDPRERDLLEAAAIAHDVGVMVEYRAHHKHSREMIANAELPGWKREDQDLVAAISRYHRRAEPSREHEEFARLDKHQRAIVRRLAAILRVADGLDRSHTQEVRGVRLSQSKRRLTLQLDAGSNASTAMNLRASKSKSQLFRDVFGWSLAFSCEQVPHEQV